MNKRVKIILSVTAVLIIGIVVFLAASYIENLKIAKQVENNYNSMLSLLKNIKSSDIKCKGGSEAVDCTVDNITMSVYETSLELDVALENVSMNIKGNKTAAKILLDFNLNVGADNIKLFTYFDESHISCEYDAKIISQKYLLKTDLLCRIKDVDNNIYTYNVDLNNVGEIFKDTDLIKLLSAENRYVISEGIKDVSIYLNSMNIETKILNNNNVIDKIYREKYKGKFEGTFIQLLKEFNADTDIENIDDDTRSVLFLKDFFVNNRKNVNIKVDAVSEDDVELFNTDFLGILYLLEAEIEESFKGNVQVKISSN